MKICTALKMILLDFLLIIIIPGIASAEDFSIPFMSTGLGICSCTTYGCTTGCQPGWFYYDAGDCPEGGYFSFLESVPQVAANVNLKQTIPPGKYYVFVKTIGYFEPTLYTVVISAGGGSNITYLNNRDWNKYWTEKIEINVLTPTNTVTINFSVDQPIEGRKVLFSGFYLTSNPKEVVLSSDTVADLTYPTVMENSAPVKGNLLENSGFEVGMGHGWGLAENRGVSLQSIRDNTVSHDGNASIKIPLGRETNNYGCGKTLISKVYNLKPNKKYTLSAWVKSGQVSWHSIHLMNIFAPPAGFPPQYQLSTSFQTTNTWQRVSVAGYALAYPTSDYQIKIAGDHNCNGDYLWVDSIQLEEGDLTDYVPKTIELGLFINKPGNIYYEDEPMEADLLVSNSGAGRSVQVDYEIYDYLNMRVKQGSVPVQIPANSVQTAKLNLSTGKRGIFRIVLWAENEEGTEEEVVYSVIPGPQTTGIDESSFMGVHPNFLDFQLVELQRLGIKWARVLSPSAFFRWKIVEPQDDQFCRRVDSNNVCIEPGWFDAEVQKAAPRGIMIMGTIGTNDYWPAWAANGSLPNLDEWEEFVGQIVSHYKPWVKYWEIWNEPYSIFTPGFYAQMQKRAVDAIEANDPDAKIVGMGGDGVDYFKSVISETERLYPAWNWTEHLDVLSTHCYPGGYNIPSFKPEIINKYNIPVWNTETGDWDWGFYAGSNSNFVSWGENLYPHNDGKRYYDGATDTPGNVAKNFLQTVGEEQTKYFYYDSRIAASPEYLRTHPTLLEYDDTIRAKGIAYSIAGHFVDHSTSLGNISIDLKTLAYLFDKAGTPVLAIWSIEKSGKSLTVPIQPTQFNVYDMMGNQIQLPGSTIPYGPQPVYVVGQGISISQFQSAIQSGSVSSRPDTTPPSVSISSAPRGPVNETSLSIRWIAVDETSTPILDNDPNYNPRAILYSFRLSGYDSSWSPWVANTYSDYSNLPQGTYTFEVQAKDDSGNPSTIESRTITIGPSSCIHKSDSNCDGCVSGMELTTFIDRWKLSNLDVTLKELIETIGLWKKGC